MRGLMRIPRVVLAAASSGSGKTTITCGILKAIADRGMRTASFKCGPDYIDPMFHSKMIGTLSSNLDLFLSEEGMARYLFCRTAKEAQIAVVEGVMGYYDGLAVTAQASTYETARAIAAPVVLIVDCKGMSLTVAALIKGLAEYRADSNIKGVILNRLPASLYPSLKQTIEEDLPVKVLGYLPDKKEISLESRHLGLVTPDETRNLSEKLSALAALCEETISIDGLIALAQEAAELPEEEKPSELVSVLESRRADSGKPVRIGVSRDEAFCFWYQDNLRLLRELGAEPVEFSPLHDERLPEGISGLWLCGGYPEVFAKELSGNGGMLREIREAVAGGIPCIAECGGFLYLLESLEGSDGITYPMAGALKGHGFKAGRLTRFGYAMITAQRMSIFGEAGTALPVHEFHHWDATENGDLFLAKKAGRDQTWRCAAGGSTLYAGFPHLYLYGNVHAADEFVSACRNF